MSHLVKTIRHKSLEETCCEIREAHDFLVRQSRHAFDRIRKAENNWGIHIKRENVDLRDSNRPDLIDKNEERLIEIINMAATIERLLAALAYFQDSEEYRNLKVKVCHPTTSDAKEENDLVLEDGAGRVRVKCEVCDVVSDKAGTNGKEKSDLKKLDYVDEVPDDAVDRYICTSSRFARALDKPGRIRRDKKYHFKLIDLKCDSETSLLLLQRGLKGE